MDLCPKCGVSNAPGAAACAGCGVILAKARVRLPTSRPVRPDTATSGEADAVPPGRALLKVVAAALILGLAAFVLTRLPGSSESEPRVASSPPAAVGLPQPPDNRADDPADGLPLTAEDVAYLSALTAKLNADRTLAPVDDEIAQVQALLIPRPENARIRTFLIDLCLRRADADFARGDRDHAQSMLAQVRALDPAHPQLALIDAMAGAPSGGPPPDPRAGRPRAGALSAPVPPERERAAVRIDADKAQIESSSFDVRFDGESQNGLARDVLFVLDRAYGRLSDVYFDKPNRRIPVVLHSQQDYYTKTGAPFWSGGVYNSHDGAIQIPVKGMPSTLPGGMENVLVHELSHAFVDEMSGGYAGRDLQEGLAQYMEGKRIEEELSPAELKRLAHTGRQTVMSFYMLSLVVSQQLVQSRGQTAVNALLKAMRETGSEDGGFQKTFGRSGAAMRAEILETFWRRYS